MFAMENTTGYTDAELTGLNEEFAHRFARGDWPTDSSEEAEEWFADEVARRRDQKAVSSAAATMGRKGGSVKSDAKTVAVRENGRKGGRPVNLSRYYIMKADASMVAGYRRVGTASNKKDAVAIQKAHTTCVNGKPYTVPQIWDEREYDAWHNREVMPWYKD